MSEVVAPALAASDPATSDSGPSRWWIALPGADPAAVRVETLHAVVSTWLDDPAEHRARLKPYAVSPMTVRRGVPGFEIGVLTAGSVDRLTAAVRRGTRVRLDEQHLHAAAPPERLRALAWDQLADTPSHPRWELEFATPMTLRSGRRASPLPVPRSMLRRLTDLWLEYAVGDHEVPDAPAWFDDAVWISALDGRTIRTELAVGQRVIGPDGRPRHRPVTVSGFLGTVEIRCDDHDQARLLGRLLRLAEFCGTGSMTEKGFGVTRVLTPARGRLESR